MTQVNLHFVLFCGDIINSHAQLLYFDCGCFDLPSYLVSLS